jgi:integration host factor subunit alpha
MALTKADIIAAIYGQGILNKMDASRAVEHVLALIKKSLINGDEVMISGFGRWGTRDKAERTGRNPQTGSSITLNARRTVYFKPSRLLKLKVKDADSFLSEEYSDYDSNDEV